MGTSILWRCLACLFIGSGIGHALAEPAPSDTPPAAEAGARKGDWSVAAGPALYVAPDYPGARSSLVYPLVYQDIEYKRRFFSRGFDLLGAYLVNDDTWQVGADFQLDPTWRRAKDNARLNGLGDVHPTLRGRAFAQATWYFVTLSADIAQDIAGQGQGLVANGDLFFSLPVGRWMFTMGPGTTWTDQRYMDTFFGVTQAQSSRSGLPVHAVGSGLREWHANAFVTYNISSHWQALAQVTFARLRGDAASSPITERRQQWTTMAAVTYRFR
ncbi:MipA/OmpV family protein [Cupriavidus sp. RAF12]|uniref:MipA/OmpV family protein n=1 Tax=Cupriavidus sp. RAF12 TaxID=3233050 RepID=UPI003F93AACF